jgi:hypothetical protein
MRTIAALLFASLLCATSAHAAPHNLDECEKIQDPMAYNACLASFGPTRKSHGAARSYPGQASEGAPRGRGHAAQHVRGAKVVQRGPHGRMHMEFFPGRRGGGG